MKYLVEAIKKLIYFKVYPFLTASEYNVIRRDKTPNQYWGEDGQNYNCMKEKTQSQQLKRTRNLLNRNQEHFFFILNKSLL